MDLIYLDYNATTPVDPVVAEAMLPYLRSYYGNPSSGHALGVQAKEALESSRARVADLIECAPSEVFFTSCASEANNTVLKGVVFSYRNNGNHIITSAMEHPSILNACRFLEAQGVRVTYVGVDHTASVDPDDVRKAIRPQTILISIMQANNEVGTVQRISEIGRIARAHGVLFHTDAAQSAGKIPISVEEMQADFVSIAGHKLYAPKGVGALYARSGALFEPLVHGAGQETGRRSGTENVIFSVALGQACQAAKSHLGKQDIRALRDLFQQQLLNHFGERIVINGHAERRLPNTLHVSFRGITGVEVLARVPEIAASVGSACHSGQVTLSQTLKAMGVSPEIGAGSVRFSLGRYSTRDEILRASELLASRL